MKPSEIIRKGWGLSAVGQDKNDPRGRQKHYQTVHRCPALRGEPHTGRLCPWAPLLKRRSSSLAVKYDVEGWGGGVGSAWGKRFEEHTQAKWARRELGWETKGVLNEVGN